MTDATEDSAALEPAAPAAAEPRPNPPPLRLPLPRPLPSLPSPPTTPAGPDLDLEGDADYLNFFAATEGLLPRNIGAYYKFDRAAAGLPARIETAEKLLRRTLDVRLLLLLAKLSILDREVTGFARWIGGVDWLLREHWDAAHPRAEQGDYSIRLGQLMALEDNAGVLLPLQHAQLLELPREGAFCYRDQLATTGAAQPRPV